MTTRNLLRNTCILALICAPASAFAAPDTGPVFTLGGLGSYDKFKLEGGRQTASAHAGQGGVFATFGNKMTAESGLIYQVGIEGKYGEK
ncbi:MAG TPA: hypothetical protein VJS90_11215, partial [Pseudomonas sp.]|nr:hypothetical protein [Pseudomonas sp.]